MAGSDEIGGVIVAEMLFIIKSLPQYREWYTAPFSLIACFISAVSSGPLNGSKTSHSEHEPVSSGLQGKHPKPRYRVIILIHRAAPPGEIRG